MEMLRIAGSLEEVEAAYQAQQGKLDAEKLLVIKLGIAGTHTTNEIAHLLKRSRGAISRWVKAFREGGIPALLMKKKPPGRPAVLNSEHQELLRQGLREGRWRTALEAHEALKQAGCPVQINDVYYWLHKLDGTLKVPRKSHVKKILTPKKYSSWSWKPVSSK
jgi:transposase